MQRVSLFILCGSVLAILACKPESVAPPVDASKYTNEAATSQPVVEAEVVLPTFKDITAEADITFTHYNGVAGKIWMPETVGAGGGFVDYDRDGDADILLINGCDWPGNTSPGPARTPELYQNDGVGRFTNVTHDVGLDRITFYGMGFTAADYDGDGDVDLFLTGVGKNFLLVQEDGKFIDRTSERIELDPAAAAPDGVPDWSLSAAWLDYDIDGDLDLFHCNYVCWTPEKDVYTTLDGRNKSYATPAVYKGQTSRLYENRDGKLVEVTKAVGLLNHNGKSMGVLVHDFNSDGYPDLFISNDTEANFLYINHAGKSFENVALAAGCGYDESGRARAGMGVSAADLTNSGDLCVAIGNFSREPVSLYQRVPGSQSLVFVDMAGKARVSRPTLLMLTFGIKFADLDLDGYQDLMLANGHIEPEIGTIQKDISFAQPAQLFRNDGRGVMVDVSARVGEDFRKPVVGRALATADIDSDGDLDVLLTVNHGPARLLRNDLPIEGRNFLRLALQGAAGNREALGAAVTIETPAWKTTRYLATGGSYLSQSELVLHVGLADASSARVEVRWPRGAVQSFGALTAGKLHVLQEGKEVAARQR